MSAMDGCPVLVGSPRKFVVCGFPIAATRMDIPVCRFHAVYEGDLPFTLPDLQLIWAVRGKYAAWWRLPPRVNEET